MDLEKIAFCVGKRAAGNPPAELTLCQIRKSSRSKGEFAKQYALTNNDFTKATSRNTMGFSAAQEEALVLKHVHWVDIDQIEILPRRFGGRLDPCKHGVESSRIFGDKHSVETVVAAKFCNRWGRGA